MEGEKSECQLTLLAGRRVLEWAQKFPCAVTTVTERDEGEVFLVITSLV